MERGGRLHFLLGAGKEETGDLGSKNWQMVQSSNTKSEIWSTRLWHKSKCWVGEAVRGCPDVG